MNRKNEILSQALLQCSTKCSIFYTEKEGKSVSLYFCKGSKNGCTKKNESVWGTNFYTADSDFCLAAKHCEVINENGGVCLFEFRNGLESYIGSKMNGVETKFYGKYDKTVVFKKYFL